MSATRVQCVLLASCPAEWAESPSVAKAPGASRRGCDALCMLSRIAAIGYPLLQMRKVARLLPAAANIHIVTSADTHADVVAWIETSGAGLGLSAANVISNGRSSDKGYAPVADVATYIDAVKPPGHVLVLETSSVLPPQMSLQEFVGNCVTCASPVFSARLARDGEHTVGLAKLELQDPTMRGPAISGVSGFEEAYGDGESVAVGPLTFLRRENLALVAEVGAAHSAAQMPDLLREMLGRGVIARALRMHGPCLALRSVDDWVLAHAFVHTFIERIKQNAKERQGVALTAPSSSAVDGVGRGPPHTMYRHAAKESTLGDIALTELGATAAVLDLEKLNAGEILDEVDLELREETPIGTRVLPARFKDVTRWDLKPLKQHPCYTTTNNDYGRKVPQQAEMPLEWYGLDGSFTNGIPFMPSATGLQTAVMRSRVHTALD